MFTCVSLSHEACLFPAVILSVGGHRFNACSVSGNCNYLIHVFTRTRVCVYVCILQVCWRLSAGQAAVVADSGPGEPHSAPGLPLLCGQSAGGAMPALLPVHEVSP